MFQGQVPEKSWGGGDGATKWQRICPSVQRHLLRCDCAPHRSRHTHARTHARTCVHTQTHTHSAHPRAKAEQWVGTATSSHPSQEALVERLVLGAACGCGLCGDTRWLSCHGPPHGNQLLCKAECGCQEGSIPDLRVMGGNIQRHLPFIKCL